MQSVVIIIIINNVIKSTREGWISKIPGKDCNSEDIPVKTNCSISNSNQIGDWCLGMSWRLGVNLDADRIHQRKRERERERSDDGRYQGIRPIFMRIYIHITKSEIPYIYICTYMSIFIGIEKLSAPIMVPLLWIYDQNQSLFLFLSLFASIITIIIILF